MFGKLTKLFKPKPRGPKYGNQDFNHFVQSDVLNLYQWHLEQVSRTLNEQRWHDASLTQNVLQVPLSNGQVRRNVDNIHLRRNDNATVKPTLFHEYLHDEQHRAPPDSRSNMSEHSILTVGDRNSIASESSRSFPLIPNNSLEVLTDHAARQAGCQNCLLISALREAGLKWISDIDRKISLKLDMLHSVQSHIRSAYEDALTNLHQVTQQVTVHFGPDYPCPRPESSHHPKIKELERGLIYIMQQESAYQNWENSISRLLSDHQPISPIPHMGTRELPSSVTKVNARPLLTDEPIHPASNSYSRILPDLPLTSSPEAFTRSDIKNLKSTLDHRTQHSRRTQPQALSRIQEQEQSGLLLDDVNVMHEANTHPQMWELSNPRVAARDDSREATTGSAPSHSRATAENNASKPHPLVGNSNPYASSFARLQHRLTNASDDPYPLCLPTRRSRVRRNTRSLYDLGLISPPNDEHPN